MSMNRIFILGGTGYAGTLIARHLLEQSDAQITISARHLEKAQNFADELNRRWPGRVKAIRADASDAASLRFAFNGHSMIVVAAPVTAHADKVVRTVLETGADYLDLQISAKKLALLQSLAGEIGRSGRCFITEAGFHPGLPSVLVRYAAAHLDTIESAVTAGYLNIGNTLPYSDAVDELIEAFRNYQAQIYKDGHWTKPNSWQMRRIDFGGDIGSKQCFSMFFEELRDLPKLYPALRNVGFFISETHWVTDWVIMPLALIWLRSIPLGTHRIGKIVWWSMRTFHRPPYLVELFVQATGQHAGQPAQFQASVSHPDVYELTAIPVVATLLQYLDSSPRRPGLWMMGHYADPVRLLNDMKRMGVKIQTHI